MKGQIELTEYDRSWQAVVRPEAAGERFEARCDGFVPVPTASDIFDGCDAADIAVVMDWRTGRVIGVHVYPLLHGAVAAVPYWAAVAQPNPPAEAIAALVADVRRLFDRYRVERGDGP